VEVEVGRGEEGVVKLWNLSMPKEEEEQLKQPIAAAAASYQRVAPLCFSTRSRRRGVYGTQSAVQL
jgi:hypothetical protein